MKKDKSIKGIFGEDIIEVLEVKDVRLLDCGLSFNTKEQIRSHKMIKEDLLSANKDPQQLNGNKLSEDIQKVLKAYQTEVEMTCGKYVKLSFTLPSGEEGNAVFFTGGTNEGFIAGVKSLVNNYKIADRAAAQIERRVCEGDPRSIRDIVEDTVWEKEFLLSISKELQQLSGKGGNEA